MATLTETAYFARKGVNLAIILGVAFLVVRASISIGIAIKERLFPTPPPPPNCAFGPLPAISAQTKYATPSGVTYSIETPDLGLPNLTPTQKVYFMPPPSGPSFSSYNKMIAQAAKLGFSGSPQKLTTSLYQFSDLGNPLRTLKLDEFTNNFEISYNYQSDPTLFSGRNFTSKEGIIGQAISYLTDVVSLPSDLSSTGSAVVLLRMDNGILKPATSISNTDAAIVTLPRGDLDGLPVVSPEINHGLVSVTLSGNTDSKKQILEARYLYAPVNRLNFATYPTISSTELFERLKAGNALISNVPETLPKSVAIRKIYLAYLEPYPSQNFLQPVLVFSDEKGFVAYVPAVQPTCTTSKQKK